MPNILTLRSCIIGWREPSATFCCALTQEYLTRDDPLRLTDQTETKRIPLHYLPDANRDNVTTTLHVSKHDVVPVADALTESVSSYHRSLRAS